jgi:hypothetical protein
MQTGETAFAHVHGMEFFPYLEQHPETAAIFDRAMTANSASGPQGMRTGYDWAGITRLVDVGGGSGLHLATVLAAHPAMHGVLFDQPAVVVRAPTVLQGAGVADRCEIVGGDFFVGVPADGDAYVLSQIIHDWEDARALQILSECRRAMRACGRGHGCW